MLMSGVQARGGGLPPLAHTMGQPRPRSPAMHYEGVDALVEPTQPHLAALRSTDAAVAPFPIGSRERERERLDSRLYLDWSPVNRNQARCACRLPVRNLPWLSQRAGACCVGCSWIQRPNARRVCRW
jgi:hypothetical protein